MKDPFVIVNLKIAKLTFTDIPALLDLAKEIGWGYNRQNWLQFMKLGLVIGHRDMDGLPISCAVMIYYDPGLRWLTSFIVSPRFQRKGLAAQLWKSFEKEISTNETPVGLISTEEGIPFYQAMGFRHSGNVHKFVRPHGYDLNFSAVIQEGVHKIVESDIQDIIALDQSAFGVGRGLMLQGKMEDALKCFKYVDGLGNIKGFAAAVREGEFLCIGPVIAPNQFIAESLILNCSKDHSNPIRMDLLSGNNTLFAKLKVNDFSEERIPPVMGFQNRLLPTCQPEYIGLAAQALG